MLAFVEILLIMALFVLAVPVVMLALEIIASVLFGSRVGQEVLGDIKRPSIAVLIPAHNEGEQMLPTLKDVLRQLVPGDRCLVVADNCDDETGAVARRAGADVIERHDLEKRGKGYALAFGIEHLSADPPDIVMVVDADCRVPSGTLLGLAYEARQTGRPCQAQYVMNVPCQASVRHRIAAFAWIVKTYIRPLGLRVLGAPCGLMGTGMAFPWAVVVERDLSTGHIVEDALIGLQLAVEGHGAMFCPKFHVRSTFPTKPASMDSQSKRWVHGSFMILVQMVPRLVGKSVRSLDRRLMLLALDTMVPPLTALILAIGVIFVVAIFLPIQGSWMPLIGSCGLLAVLAVSLGIAWASCGTDILHATDVLKLPFYLISKLSTYLEILRGQGSGWTRTDRD